MNDFSKFTIRVYGLFLNSRNELLVVDEYQLDTAMTKFPGGGLEYGEGPVDCLKREAMEEMNQAISVGKHFYTTHFFQPAFFYRNVQLLSIYYRAELLEPERFTASKQAFDFEEKKNGNMSFRWMPLQDIYPEMFTFPVDQHVVKMIEEKGL